MLILHSLQKSRRSYRGMNLPHRENQNIPSVKNLQLPSVIKVLSKLLQM